MSGLLEGPDIGCTEGGAGDLCCAEGPIGVMGEPEVGYGCPIEAGLIAGAVPEPPTEPAIQSDPYNYSTLIIDSKINISRHEHSTCLTFLISGFGCRTSVKF